MKVCQSCGHMNDGDAGTCTRCGGEVQPAPRGPSGKCARCGAMAFGQAGTAACKFCGGSVEIRAGAPWQPPLETSRPLRKDDVDVLEMREVKRSEANNGAVVAIIMGVVVGSSLLVGAIVSAEHHHKRREKSKASYTSSYSRSKSSRTASVYQKPRFEPIARKLTLTSSTGALPFKEKSCDMRISPLRASNECRVWITCGSVRVYGGANSWVKCGPRGGTPTFATDLDPTQTDGDAQLHVDLVKKTATLSDTSLAGDNYMATFGLDTTTDPPPPAPPAFGRVTRTATVTSKIGSVPFTASTCQMSISPLSDPDECRVILTCGGRRVYGSSTSYTSCEASNDGPVLLNDWKPSTKDHDAKLQANLTLGVAALADTKSTGEAYLVKFRLSK